MKLRLLSLAAMAAFVGQAHALSPTQIDAARADGSLLEVTMSGATALSGTTGGLFTQNCKSGTQDIYLNDAALFSGETVNGNIVKAYSCELNATNDFGAHHGQFDTYSFVHTIKNKTLSVQLRDTAGAQSRSVSPCLTGARPG